MKTIYYCNLVKIQYELNLAKHGEQSGGLINMVLAEEIGELARACIGLRFGECPIRVREEAVDCLSVVLAMVKKGKQKTTFR